MELNQSAQLCSREADKVMNQHDSVPESKSVPAKTQISGEHCITKMSTGSGSKGKGEEKDEFKVIRSSFMQKKSTESPITAVKSESEKRLALIKQKIKRHEELNRVAYEYITTGEVPDGIDLDYVLQALEFLTEEKASLV